MYYWNNPRNNRSQVVIGNESVFVGPWVYINGITNDDLTKREFIKGGDIIFLLTMQGRFCEVTSENKFNFKQTEHNDDKDSVGRLLFIFIVCPTFSCL